MDTAYKLIMLSIGEHTSFAVRMAKLRLHASFKFHTALYHVEIVHARVYVLDSRF
jgi:hypothetical protein